jgi:hypothetical protein
VKCLNFIGDGDSKAFSAVEHLQPCDGYVTYIKLECVCHVENYTGHSSPSTETFQRKMCEKKISR